MVAPIISKSLLNILSILDNISCTNSIIDKLDVLDMLNIFMEVVKFLDISRYRHTNPIPKVPIDTESKYSSTTHHLYWISFLD
jgi:hypothetical protein